MSRISVTNNNQTDAPTAQTAYGQRIRTAAVAMVEEGPKSIDHLSAVTAYVQYVKDTLGLTIT
jgi:hypothetical protein